MIGMTVSPNSSVVKDDVRTPATRLERIAPRVTLDVYMVRHGRPAVE